MYEYFKPKKKSNQALLFKINFRTNFYEYF